MRCAPAHYRLWYALPMLLHVIIAGCGNSPAPLSSTEQQSGEPPAPVPTCGDGIAARDLAGNCRSVPNPTMGALEAT